MWLDPVDHLGEEKNVWKMQRFSNAKWGLYELNEHVNKK
jgi:hypothetical protein